MNKYVIFLRGVNVSGKNKIKMADLRVTLEDYGFVNVKTYIQSGNILLNTLLDRKLIMDLVAQLIKDKFKIEVPVVVKKVQELKELVVNDPYANVEPDTYFVMLLDEPNEKLRQDLKSENYNTETFTITASCVYLLCQKGYGKAKCNNNFFESKLKVMATTRNLKTMKALLALAEG